MHVDKVLLSIVALFSIGLLCDGIGVRVVAGGGARDRVTGCPCVEPSLCGPVKIKHKKEVFIFSLDPANWKKYPYDLVTTVAATYAGTSKVDVQMMCYAHSHNVRVVPLVNFPTNQLTNQTARALWVAQQVARAKQYFLDGINIDFEDAIQEDEKDKRDGLTALTREAKEAFFKALPGSQVTFDVAWSPACIDSRCYDWVGLSRAADFLFVMSYDERSQIRSGPCAAGPNSAYPVTLSGIKEYLKLGISPQKLVLGIPWYGYNYPCLNITKDNLCYIKKVPFRGVPCSDAAGREINFSIIQEKLLNISTSGRLWDQKSLSPYFNYKDISSGQVTQVWYDDPESLIPKYMFARSAGMYGVGMWNADAIDYSDTEQGMAQQKAMWGAIRTFL